MTTRRCAPVSDSTALLLAWVEFLLVLVVLVFVLVRR
jgi:hypothetical protein